MTSQKLSLYQDFLKKGELVGFHATRKKSMENHAELHHQISRNIENYYDSLIRLGESLYVARQTLMADYSRFLREEFDMLGKEGNFYIRLWERFSHRRSLLPYFYFDALQEVCRKSFPLPLIDMICRELHQEPKRLTSNDIWIRKHYWLTDTPAEPISIRN